jgi:PilZ domain
MPSPSIDLRRHPRFEFLAHVEVHRAEDTLILPARNLSLGGIYLSSDGNDLSRFEIGAAVEVVLFDAKDESRAPLRGMASVARRDSDGVALKWNDEALIAAALGELIAAIQPAR